MRYKSFLLLLIVNFWNVYCAFAQADISMATHWYNRSNYNPASIARTEYIYYFSNIRQQWLGLEGAPSVLNIQASEYIHHLKSAFGISLVGEKIGVSTAYNPMLTYAYRISGEHDWSISMGLSGGVFVRTINGALFEAENITDPAISYETGQRISPDANLGFEFQSNYFILSLSSTHLFSINQSNQLYLNSNHRYGSIIYKNDNSELMNYHIGMQVVNRGNLTILEGNVCVRFKRPTGLVKGPREIFELGLTYRTSHQITGLFGMNISPNIRIGYAIDWSYSMGYNQNGTHELMLEFRIPSSISSTKRQCPNPDYWYH